MKKTLCYVLSVCQLIWSTACAADAMEDALHAAEEMRTTLQETFEPYLRTSTESAIKSMYLYLFWDHVITQRALAVRSSNGLYRLNGLRSDFKSSLEKLVVDDTNWEANATHALALVAEAQSLKNDAEAVRDDTLMMQQSWREECSPPSRTKYGALFTPLSNYQLMDIGEAPSPIAPNLEFNVQVSTSYGENGTSTTGYGSVSEGGKQNTGEQVGGGMITVGIALCSMSNPWCVLAGVILIVAGALVEYFSAIADQVKQAVEAGRLATTLKDIRDYQIGVVQHVGGLVPDMVNKTCAASFPPESADKLPLEIYSTYLKDTAKFYTEVTEQREKIYQQYSDHLKRLDTEYYPKVKETYLALIQSHFAKTEETGIRINKMIEEILAPLLTSLKEARKNGGVKQWQDQQKIWSAMIEGDALYRTRSDYSFLPAGEEDLKIPAFDNYWNDFGQKLQGVLQ